MNIPQLKLEQYNLLLNTPNLTAAEKTKVRNRFVAMHPTDWLAFLAANNLTDTAQSRGQFVAHKIIMEMRRVYMSGSDKENQATLPAPDTFE